MPGGRGTRRGQDQGRDLGGGRGPGKNASGRGLGEGRDRGQARLAQLPAAGRGSPGPPGARLGVGLEKGRGREVWRPGVWGCEARASEVNWSCPFDPVCALPQAKFELITSEASYIHSLSVAVGHFLGSAELSECLGAQDKQWLFSKLPEVKSTSER